MSVINALTGKAVDPQIMAALEASLTVSYGITIAPETVSKIPIQAPLLARLRSLGRDVVKPDKAAVYSILTSSLFTGSNKKAAFTVGGDPNAIDPKREMHAVTKKSYGASGGITDVDIIASTIPGAPISINTDRFADDAALLLELLYRISLEGIDEDIINGDATSYPVEFDGLETKVASGVSGFYVDKAGADLTAGMIIQQIAWMMAAGVYPTALYCNPIMHYAIVEAFKARTGLTITLGDKSVGPMGVWANSLVTPAGELPIVSDRFFSISTDGTHVSGDIFFAVEFHRGVRLLYPEWMVLPIAIPLSKVMGRGRATSSEMAVWAHLVLVERTNWWAQGRLANVKADFTPQPSSPAVGGA
jgi:hypothetical protein